MTCLQKLECKLHRLECHALAKLDKERRKSVTPTIRMMVKLYLRRKLQNENVMGLFFIYFFIVSYVRVMVCLVLWEII